MGWLAAYDDGADEADERGNPFGQLFVASGYSTVVLDAAEEAFDEVAMTVDCFAPSNVLASIGPRRDYDLGAHACDQVPQGLGVVGFVGRHAFGRYAAQQLWRLGDVVHLPLGKAALNQLANGIDHDVNLRRQSASGTPERLGAVFLGAPAACW